MPPASVTTAPASANSGVHGGAVVAATRTSPGASRAASASEPTTRATPVTRPDEPGAPVTTSGSAAGAGTPGEARGDTEQRARRRRARGHRPERRRRRGARVGGERGAVLGDEPARIGARQVERGDAQLVVA